MKTKRGLLKKIVRKLSSSPRGQVSSTSVKPYKSGGRVKLKGK